MNNGSYEIVTHKAEAFKVLAHPMRLFILEKLLNRECSLTELLSLTGQEKTKLQKHLCLLENAGLIAKHKKDINTIYSIQKSCVRNIITCVDWKE